MTIKHKQDTYSSLPIQPKANPLNSVDGIPCWAGKLTEPMPAHPLPFVVEVSEEDELTPEKWLAEQDAKRRIIATGQIKSGVLTKLVVDAAIEARHVEVHAFADELAAMDADLAALRAQVVEPVAKMTDEQLEQIEAEHIGAEHSAKPFLY